MSRANSPAGDDGEQLGQFDKGGKVAEQSFDDELSGQELFENLKPICIKKVGKTKFGLQEA